MSLTYKWSYKIAVLSDEHWWLQTSHVPPLPTQPRTFFLRAGSPYCFPTPNMLHSTPGLTRTTYEMTCQKGRVLEQTVVCPHFMSLKITGKCECSEYREQKSEGEPPNTILILTSGVRGH